MGYGSIGGVCYRAGDGASVRQRWGGYCDELKKNGNECKGLVGDCTPIYVVQKVHNSHHTLMSSSWKRLGEPPQAVNINVDYMRILGEDYFPGLRNEG